MLPRLTAVIPTLDEERALGPTLAALRPEVDRIVVADGGSSDGTAALAASWGALLVSAAGGRGAQLAAGANAAPGSALWFVHADTRVPPGSGALVRAALAGDAVGGAFEVRFDGPGWRYRLGSHLASARSRRGGLFLGDQAPFASLAAYEALGGMRPWPLFEDVDFSRRLRRLGRTVVLRPPVVTSARRFAASGPLRGVAKNWLLLALFDLGLSPERLARHYQRIR